MATALKLPFGNQLRLDLTKIGTADAWYSWRECRGVIRIMSKRDEYRQFATTSLELAEKTSNAHKMRLLLMAEAWLDLAERTARLPKRSVGDHPLVRQVLGSR